MAHDTQMNVEMIFEVGISLALFMKAGYGALLLAPFHLLTDVILLCAVQRRPSSTHRQPLAVP